MQIETKTTMHFNPNTEYRDAMKFRKETEARGERWKENITTTDISYSLTRWSEVKLDGKKHTVK